MDEASAGGGGAVSRRPRIKAVLTSLPTRRKLSRATTLVAPTPLLPPAAVDSPRVVSVRTPDALPPAPAPRPHPAPTPPAEVAGATRCGAGAVDGIVPLACVSPRSLDTIKTELLSSRARVLFDPLVPLPGTPRARCKLRPAPRLSPAPSRQRSHHGSASESEEEGRRRDAPPPAPAPPAPVLPPASTPALPISLLPPSTDAPSLSKHEALPKVAPALHHSSSPPRIKHWTHRRGRGGGGGGAVPERDSLTMYDLIFYNPTTNPIKPAAEEARAGAPSPSPAPAPAAPASPAPASPHAPAPQIKIGANGEVIIDEQSLVLQQPSGETCGAAPVVETAGRGGRYTRAARTKSWSDAETVRFYRALAAIGTDFSLMLPLFPDRQRRELKLKFKKEERSNVVQVERALSARRRFAADKMADEFARERAEAAHQAERTRRAAVELRREQRERARRARRQGFTFNRAARASGEVLPAARGACGRGATCADDLVALERVRRAEGAYELSAGERRVAPGSLVCLALPAAGGARVLQTYVAGAGGSLAPVDVSPAVLSALADHIH